MRNLNHHAIIHPSCTSAHWLKSVARFLSSRQHLRKAPGAPERVSPANPEPEAGAGYKDEDCNHAQLRLKKTGAAAGGDVI